MKGYKATINGKCRDQLYEVGHTYSCNYLVMCERGFHFCQELKDVFRYYLNPEPFGEELIVYEVEALGEIETEGNKSVTDRIRIVSVVDPQDYAHLIDTHEYDERGNLIKKITPNGRNRCYEYDDRGNKTKEIHPYGDIYSYKYDDQGNLIKIILPSGITYSFEYDERGYLTKDIRMSGAIYSYEYDDQGNRIKEVRPNGDTHYEYDDQGNLIKEIASNGYIHSIHSYEYDDHGDRIRETYSGGTVVEYETYPDFKVTVEKD